VSLLETELVEWSREELKAGVSHTTFRKAAQTANLLFDLMNREERATRQGQPRWEDNGSVYYRSRFRMGRVEVHVGSEPEQWKPTFPTPVTFGIKSDDVPDDLKPSVHHAYVEVVDRLRVADSAPFEQLSFTTSPLSATWWWGRYRSRRTASPRTRSVFSPSQNGRGSLRRSYRREARRSRDAHERAGTATTAASTHHPNPKYGKQESSPSMDTGCSWRFSHVVRFNRSRRNTACRPRTTALYLGAVWGDPWCCAAFWLRLHNDT
jgi:hypothetical protein